MPHLIAADFYNDTELTDELQKSQMNLDGSGANNSHGGISHTHDYVGFWPNGVVVENNICGLSHKHKILGVPEKIQLIQPMYKTSDFKKMVSTHFEEFSNDEKFPFGPITSPRPGPTLEIEVAAPEIDVTKSKPVKDNIAVKEKKIIIYKNIKDITDDINLSSIIFLSYLITKIPLG